MQHLVGYWKRHGLVFLVLRYTTWMCEVVFHHSKVYHVATWRILARHPYYAIQCTQPSEPHGTLGLWQRTNWEMPISIRSASEPRNGNHKGTVYWRYHGLHATAAAWQMVVSLTHGMTSASGLTQQHMCSVQDDGSRRVCRLKQTCMPTGKDQNGWLLLLMWWCGIMQLVSTWLEMGRNAIRRACGLVTVL